MFRFVSLRPAAILAAASVIAFTAPVSAQSAPAKSAKAKPDYAALCGQQDAGAPPSTKPSDTAQTARISPAQLRADLAKAASVLHHCDPDLGHSADPAKIDAMLHTIASSLNHPMTRDEAWRAFARLNPVIADGHTGIFFNSWRKESKAHLASDGVFFPFEVDVSTNGQLRVLTALGGRHSALAGARITAINGVTADKIVSALLARVHGDTPAFRAGLLSRRFAFFYWKMYGTKAAFDIGVEQGGARKNLHIAGRGATPVALAEQTEFSQAFHFRLLPCRSALLTINIFYWPDKERFYAFTKDAFTKIKKAGVKTLIIDIRRNEGGDDDMWIKGIMPYIATTKYRFASAYKKRVLPHHTEDGYKIGDVASGAMDSWTQPELDNPLHYSGKTIVLIGRATYSSAILFTNVMQEFNFARIAGQGGMARADQSGGTFSTVLPNTGLEVGWPRFILTRPSGKTTPQFVEPDVVIARDPLQPSAAITKLLHCASTKSDPHS